jgi:hypothetical protein
VLIVALQQTLDYLLGSTAYIWHRGKLLSRTGTAIIRGALPVQSTWHFERKPIVVQENAMGSSTGGTDANTHDNVSTLPPRLQMSQWVQTSHILHLDVSLNVSEKATEVFSTYSSFLIRQAPLPPGEPFSPPFSSHTRLVPDPFVTVRLKPPPKKWGQPLKPPQGIKISIKY